LRIEGEGVKRWKSIGVNPQAGGRGRGGRHRVVQTEHKMPTQRRRGPFLELFKEGGGVGSIKGMGKGRYSLMLGRECGGQ